VVLHTLARGIRIEEEVHRIAREAVRMLEEGKRHMQEVVHIPAGEERRTVVEEGVARKAVERELHMELVDRNHLADQMAVVEDIHLVDCMEAAGHMVVDWEEGIAGYPVKASHMRRIRLEVDNMPSQRRTSR